ncbi:Forkhead domain [Popillia japonica]|uniref:Forkhead domain n=1 Tax=Popillia japonica TaxID=7064 RepID=A0AAW1LRH4_POPJA
MNGSNTNCNNNYIVRDSNTFPRTTTTIQRGNNFLPVKHWSNLLNSNKIGTITRASLPLPSNHCNNLRKNFERNRNSLPQIAIKRKDNESPCSTNTEVVLLNGNWDTSNKIPNIIAEMHNVNVEELQTLQNSNTCSNSKQIKLELNDCATPSPLGSDSGIEADCADGNLSWLLNYKIHELPPVPDCQPGDPPSYGNSCGNGGNQMQILKPDCKYSQIYATNNDSSKHNYYQQQVQNINITRQEKQTTINNSCKIDDATKTQNHAYRYTGPKKPPFTYTELIEHALNEKGELTVSGIYQWISDHFPFYKQNDDRWKNSVRHNLSINPHFRKGSKAVHGAGHLWTIAQREDKKTWNIKKQRMQQFIQTTLNDWNKERQNEIELAAATASILPENTEDINAHVMKMDVDQTQMNGKKQNVEVEYIIDVSGGLGDFLCPPVSKEQVVEECGLGGDYLITDLNPNTLGLNLTEAEIISGANLYDDLNFQCYELQTE